MRKNLLKQDLKALIRFPAVVLILAAAITSVSFSQSQLPPVSVTILYDDHPFRQGLKTGQGFSCLIQGTEKTILFDTGERDPESLIQNFAALKFDPKDVDVFVISRAVPERLSGLTSLLARKGESLVFLPASAPPDFVKQVEKAKGRVELVTNPVSVCEGVFSTGQISGEQALVIDTPKGLIILTGCAQAGMVDIVAKARSVMPKEVYLLMGGFELGGRDDADLLAITRQLRQQTVKSLGATHCTPSRAIALLKKEFGKGYVALGAGKEIVVR